MIIRESYRLLRSAFSPLLDSSLSDEETRIITEVIQKRGFSFHHLRTRKSGRYRFADMHLELPETMILTEVHKICDEIENEIEGRIIDIDLEIHVEPMDSHQI